MLAVPGPTAMASALSVSGFDTREFAFYGFLPRAKKDLEEKVHRMAPQRRTCGGGARISAPGDGPDAGRGACFAGVPCEREL